MRDPADHTAEEALPGELWRASVRLLLMLVALAVVLIPLIFSLPLGPTAQTGLLAWLLVALAFYWLYAGMGYRALLLLQLLLFSAAAILLTTKAGLVVIGVERLSILRRSAIGLILAGSALAGINLVSMLVAVVRRGSRSTRTPPPPPS